MRTVCRFSCGVTSAVATKLALADDASALIVNAFIVEEHADNRRFLADCQRWFGKKITVLSSAKYAASTDEVWRRKRFMKGLRGAPCSRELKAAVLESIRLPGDIDILGYDMSESDRFALWQQNHPEHPCRAPLIERGLSKSDCFTIVAQAGIELPMMYRMGYPNANCIGCPKAGQNYWQRIREDFPERFIQIQAIQEDIGPGAYFLRHRSGPKAGQRMPLSELPPGRGNLADEPDFSCSFVCQSAIDEIGLARLGESGERAAEKNESRWGGATGVEET